MKNFLLSKTFWALIIAAYLSIIGLPEFKALGLSPEFYMWADKIGSWLGILAGIIFRFQASIPLTLGKSVDVK